MTPSAFAATAVALSAVVAGTGLMTPRLATHAVDDRDAVEVVTTIDRGEIEAGTLALGRATSKEVKELAKMLVNDHQKSLAKLDKIAPFGARPGPARTTPAESAAAPATPQQKVPNPSGAAIAQQLGDAHQAGMQRLRAVSGAEFDRAYVEAMVSGHEAALQAVQQVAPTVTTPALREFMTEKESTIQRHLDKSRAVQQALATVP